MYGKPLQHIIIIVKCKCIRKYAKRLLFCMENNFNTFAKTLAQDKTKTNT